MEVHDRPAAAANKDFYYNTKVDNYGTFIWQCGSPIVSNSASGSAHDQIYVYSVPVTTAVPGCTAWRARIRLGGEP